MNDKYTRTQVSQASFHENLCGFVVELIAKRGPTPLGVIRELCRLSTRGRAVRIDVAAAILALRSNGVLLIISDRLDGGPVFALAPRPAFARPKKAPRVLNVLALRA